MIARKFLSLTAAATMVATSFGVAAPAMARDHYRDYRGDYSRDYRDYREARRYDYRDDRRYDYRDARRYDRRNYAYNQRCRDNGTGGTIIGAIAGGLLGHEVAGRRGDKTAGVIIGGAVGAIAGRAIDKSDSRC
ncbi:MAG: glycine zipper 2TM domain-containing protein [Alphaproteobacteria bacterium]|nr:glycine zipper 2TM domain-containing protein [Alphaproteobacteria bacterium]MBU0793795.1 glycine zipper 2TM domain-containing protein [Alphaproteobacteria bacterium]MBU0875202.1 glycine zipper 2TM domain-containing protein [Alphaproteobacteria bacterium]MBU1768951.1 glycine zipper 2TM domain-containing protein [Alphaproteobacteria bacterium]